MTTLSSLPAAPCILKIALPLPLPNYFDYLTRPSVDASEYKIGMRVKVTFGHRVLTGIIAEHSQSTELPIEKIIPITTLLDTKSSITSPLFKLLKWASDYYMHPPGEVFSASLPVLLRQAKNAPDDRVNFWFPNKSAQNTELPKNAVKQQKLLSLINEHINGIPETTCIELGFSKQQLASLQEKQLIFQEKLIKPTPSLEVRAPFKSVILSKEQAPIVSKFSKQLDIFKPSLLEGITGSGKTEVYIACIQSILKLNRQALLLVPEINLTPQTLQRFQQYFSEAIGVIHSGMSTKARYETWSMAKSGRINIVIGTRSAIFTAFKNLGGIIVDEEHDLSYKQQEGFRYSARNLAIKRAQIEDIPVLLGSATPSLESLYNVELKRYQYFSLQQRAGNAKLPDVKLLDIRTRPLKAGISPPLLESISKQLNAQNQVLVFLNRRGYSPVLTCSDCGWLADCLYCDARLTLHKSPPRLHCHHCDHRYPIPRTCPECTSQNLSILGKGTEQIEEYLEQQFPETPVLRVDRDSTSRKSSVEKILSTVEAGEPCILIGTQMLAKGHNFPKVTLVALIDPDAGLFSADFRALEHTAQQIIQVAGRAGRGDDKGNVIIQTRHADHPIMQAICKHDYQGISALLLNERREAKLPPIYPAVIVRAESETLERADQALVNIKKKLAGMPTLSLADNTPEILFEIIGPYPASMQRKANVFRAQLMLILQMPTARAELNRLLPEITSGNAFRKVRVSIDVDPVICN